MAKRNKQLEVELPDGVSVENKADGSRVYIATAGSGSRRRQYRFATQTDAEAFRRQFELEEIARKDTGRPSLTKDEFVTSRRATDEAPSRPSIQSVRVMDMLDELTKELESRVRNGAHIATNTRNIKRFFCDLVATPKRVFEKEAKGFIIDDAVDSIDLNESLSDEESARVREYYRGQNCGLAERTLEVPLLAYEVTARDAEQFKVWLYNMNYSLESQKEMLSQMDQFWDLALARHMVWTNVFKQQAPIADPLPQYNRNGEDRYLGDAPAWTAAQIVATARLLRPVYLLVFWLCVSLGFRRSEPFGIRLGDWNADSLDLFIGKQRRGSPRQGLTDTKVANSRRPLPVPRVIGSMINQYISEMHPPRPTDPAGIRQWEKRLLIVGVHGGPMDPSSFVAAVRNAGIQVGLRPEWLGAFRPVHHLRKTIGGFLQNQIGVVTPRAASVILRHRIEAVDQTGRAARTSDVFYNPIVLSELTVAIEQIDRWLLEQVVPLLGTDDLLHPTTFDDPISMGDAVEMLSTVGEPKNADYVVALIGAGDIEATKVNHTNSEDEQEPVVSRKSVQQVLAELMREEQATYSAQEVGRLLNVVHARVYSMAEMGLFSEVERRSCWVAGPHQSGSLPGGGRRYSKDEVHRFIENNGEWMTRTKNWLKPGEVAERLGVSIDTVRRRGKSGELEVWIDPYSKGRDFYYSLDSVEKYRNKFHEVSFSEAAEMLGLKVTTVRLMAKFGDLERGSRFNKILVWSIEAYKLNQASLSSVVNSHVRS